MERRRTITMPRSPLIQGDEARKASGFPLSFLEAVSTVTSKMGCVASFRAGQPPLANKGYQTQPKPGSILTKSFNDAQGIPFLSGRVFGDPLLMRKKSKPLPDNTPMSPSRVALKELVAQMGTNKAEVSMVGDYLVYQPKLSENNINACNNPDLANAQFRIKVKDGGSPPDIIHTEQQKQKIQPHLDIGEVKRPDHWPEDWGDFYMLSNHLFAIEVQAPGEPWRPLLEGGQPPFTGDADGFAYCYSKAFRDEYPQANVKLNLGEVKSMQTCFMQLVLLENKFHLIPALANLKIGSTEYFKAMTQLQTTLPTGITTSAEAYTAMAINYQHTQQSSMQHMVEIILHGPETNNPYDPSPLDGNVVFIEGDRVELTINERSLGDKMFALHTRGMDTNLHEGWPKSFTEKVKVQRRMSEVQPQKSPAPPLKRETPTWMQEAAQKQQNDPNARQQTQEDQTQKQGRGNFGKD